MSWRAKHHQMPDEEANWSRTNVRPNPYKTDKAKTYSRALTMAGLVHELARWSVSTRRQAPAGVVRSCSKLLGSSMESVK